MLKRTEKLIENIVRYKPDCRTNHPLNNSHSCEVIQEQTLKTTSTDQNTNNSIPFRIIVLITLSVSLLLMCGCEPPQSQTPPSPVDVTPQPIDEDDKPSPQTMDEEVAAALVDAKAAKPAATLSSLLGIWKAKIVMIEASSDNQHELLDVTNTPPILLTVKEEAGQYILRFGDDPDWKSRVLVIQDSHVVAKGKPTLSLSLKNNLLIGSLEQNNWRLEFHAQNTK